MSISAPPPRVTALDMPRFAERLEAASALARTSTGPGALEVVLTEGYSEVLRLEADRRRARKRLLDDLRRSGRDDDANERLTAQYREIAELTARIERLRGLLAAASRRLRVS